MTNCVSFLGAVLAVMCCAAPCGAGSKVITERNGGDAATVAFQFKNVPQPSRSDAATNATFTIVGGRRDRNGGNLEKLHDGQVPIQEDEPSESFFFNAGSEGGRLLVDLGSAIDIQQVNTYSWHPGTRGPQVYKLYGNQADTVHSDRQTTIGTDPHAGGWKLIATVDTRPASGSRGGQYAVSISDADGMIGNCRYLLFDISATEQSDAFGNTFFSEIDVVEPGSKFEAALPAGRSGGKGIREIVEAGGGKYRISIDTTETPDLTEWAHNELAPVVEEWYPKIVAMLPSEGYEAPTSIGITFSPNMRGVAATSGTHVRCAARWFTREREGEAKGAVVHELVHVVQSYGRARRANPDAVRPPGWLVEGIADYIRWFLYEPETHGADITRRNISRARYDGSYRLTANFLNWASQAYGKDLVPKLNEAARAGACNEELWTKLTGHTLQQLGDQWVASLEGNGAAGAANAVSADDSAQPNALTDEEKAAGWKLLFNGRNLDGWHNFKRQDVRPGWKIENGALVCSDPHNAGDLCTNDQYQWFELQLDYNISEGGNSGIMYHVTDQGNASWATGPEFQLEDNSKAADPIRCGWLYALYQPPIDPKTNKPLDSTRPAGQWNHIRLLITSEKCEHEINGVKYFDYVLGSDDFKQRVATSKFGRMPLFSKSNTGYIALQGDHGQVSFRNIKIRPIQTK